MRANVLRMHICPLYHDTYLFAENVGNFNGREFFRDYTVSYFRLSLIAADDVPSFFAGDVQMKCKQAVKENANTHARPAHRHTAPHLGSQSASHSSLNIRLVCIPCLVRRFSSVCSYSFSVCGTAWPNAVRFITC